MTKYQKWGSNSLMHDNALFSQKEVKNCIRTVAPHVGVLSPFYPHHIIIPSLSSALQIRSTSPPKNMAVSRKNDGGSIESEVGL